MKTKGRMLVSILLVAVLILGMVPLSVSAATPPQITYEVFFVTPNEAIIAKLLDPTTYEKSNIDGVTQDGLNEFVGSDIQDKEGMDEAVVKAATAFTKIDNPEVPTAAGTPVYLAVKFHAVGEWDGDAFDQQLLTDVSTAMGKTFTGWTLAAANLELPTDKLEGYDPFNSGTAMGGFYNPIANGPDITKKVSGSVYYRAAYGDEFGTLNTDADATYGAIGESTKASDNSKVQRLTVSITTSGFVYPEKYTTWDYVVPLQVKGTGVGGTDPQTATTGKTGGTISLDLTTMKGTSTLVAYVTDAAQAGTGFSGTGNQTKVAKEQVDAGKVSMVSDPSAGLKFDFASNEASFTASSVVEGGTSITLTPGAGTVFADQTALNGSGVVTVTANGESTNLLASTNGVTKSGDNVVLTLASGASSAQSPLTVKVTSAGFGSGTTKTIPSGGVTATAAVAPLPAAITFTKTSTTAGSITTTDTAAVVISFKKADGGYEEVGEVVSGTPLAVSEEKLAVLRGYLDTKNAAAGTSISDAIKVAWKATPSISSNTAVTRAEAPSALTISSYTKGSEALSAAGSDNEYKIDSGSWADGSANAINISSTVGNAAHTAYVRVKETASTFASAAVSTTIPARPTVAKKAVTETTDAQKKAGQTNVGVTVTVVGADKVTYTLAASKPSDGTAKTGDLTSAATTSGTLIDAAKPNHIWLNIPAGVSNFASADYVDWGEADGYAYATVDAVSVARGATSVVLNLQGADGDVFINESTLAKYQLVKDTGDGSDTTPTSVDLSSDKKTATLAFESGLVVGTYHIVAVAGDVAAKAVNADSKINVEVMNEAWNVKVGTVSGTDAGAAVKTDPDTGVPVPKAAAGDEPTEIALTGVGDYEKVTGATSAKGATITVKESTTNVLLYKNTNTPTNLEDDEITVTVAPVSTALDATHITGAGYKPYDGKTEDVGDHKVALSYPDGQVPAGYADVKSNISLSGTATYKTADAGEKQVAIAGLTLAPNPYFTLAATSIDTLTLTGETETTGIQPVTGNGMELGAIPQVESGDTVSSLVDKLKNVPVSGKVNGSDTSISEGTLADVFTEASGGKDLEDVLEDAVKAAAKAAGAYDTTGTKTVDAVTPGVGGNPDTLNTTPAAIPSVKPGDTITVTLPEGYTIDKTATETAGLPAGYTLNDDGTITVGPAAQAGTLTLKTKDGEDQAANDVTVSVSAVTEPTYDLSKATNGLNLSLDPTTLRGIINPTTAANYGGAENFTGNSAVAVNVTKKPTFNGGGYYYNPEPGPDEPDPTGPVITPANVEYGDVEGEFKVDENGKITEMPTVTPKYGLEFLGWSVDPENENKIINEKTFVVTDDTTLYAMYRGYINGIDGHGYPNENVTRAQLVRMLVVATGTYDSSVDYGKPSFTDCQTGWYVPYVAAAEKAGIVEGYTGYGQDNTFRPNDPITRQEAAAMVARTFGIEPVETTSSDKVVDFDKVSFWAKQYVGPLLEMGILKGLPGEDGNEFQAQKNLTRAEAVKMINRLLDFTDADAAEVKANQSSYEMPFDDLTAGTSGWYIPDFLFATKSLPADYYTAELEEAWNK